GSGASPVRPRRRNAAGPASRIPRPAPTEDTPRGPRQSAEGSGRGHPGRERRRQAAQLLVENRQQFRRRLLLFGAPLFIGQRHRRRIFRTFDHPAAPFSYDSIEATDGNSVSPRGDSAPEQRTTATAVNETGRRVPSPQWWADSHQANGQRSV